MLNFKGVIFDLDGTLVDTIADLAAAGNYGLEANGFAPVEPDSYRYHVGTGMRNLAKNVLAASLAVAPKTVANKEETIGSIYTAINQYYDKNWHNLSKPYPGIKELLAELLQRQIPFAVCSNKPDAFVKEMIAFYFNGIEFVDTIGPGDVMPLKPDPTGPLWLAEKMNLQPANIVFCGDTKIDMQTAAAAGMFACGVNWGFRPKQELMEHGAGRIIDNASELLDLF
ncbi:HAD hydrolase-like protein [Desulfovibrio sp. OttesenSCG-928-F07]|nr:HAD hydrolase-like protein [Desulfovibrio sp. OttesenSCG-928-F07]